MLVLADGVFLNLLTILSQTLCPIPEAAASVFYCILQIIQMIYHTKNRPLRPIFIHLTRL